MPGQIKIDDGSGNYTILTNAGSLSSDKTITIPNTTGTMALTSDITSGLDGFQQFRLNANLTSNAQYITANWEAPDSDYVDYLRRLPATYQGQMFNPTGDFEYSFAFSLDDIIIDHAANTVTYKSGSRKAGDS